MGKGWIKNTDGAAAVEFALISVPFIYLLIGIIEMSFMYVGMTVLDHSTDSASRLIRTGQAQQSMDAEQTFKDELCQQAKIFLNCNNIQYEVIKLDNFSDYSSYDAVYDTNGDLVSQGFDPGVVNNVVLIRTIYKYPLITPLLAQLMADDGSTTKKFISTVVLETEPYDVEQVADQL